MPLLNYTTELPASRSIAEITALLQDGGATALMFQYGVDREVTAITFQMPTTFGVMPFTLPAKVPEVINTLNAQIRAETAKVNQRSNYKRKIPRNLFNNRAQAERIAWRITKDWLEAQLAMVEIGNAKLEQIMMPFVQIGNRSFYEVMVERGTLALPAPRETRDPNDST